MIRSTLSRTRPGWLRRLGRMLAIVAQLVVLVAPIAEAREDRALAAHVEQPGGQQHPEHHPERCPACILLSVHSRAAERTNLPALDRAERVAIPAEARYATHCVDAPANSCRAPPTSV